LIRPSVDPHDLGLGLCSNLVPPPRRCNQVGFGLSVSARQRAEAMPADYPVGRWLTDLYAGLGVALSRSALLAGWQCRQGVELGLVQGDVGRGGVGGDLHFSFRADDRRGDRRPG
jgi:hypothetical protein